MTTRPWTEPVKQPEPPEKRAWWEEGGALQNIAQNWTMPWQKEHWTDPQPEWSRTAGKAGLGIGMVAGGLALGAAGVPAAAGMALRAAPWLTRAAVPFMAHPTAITALGGLGGLLGSSIMAPGGLGKPQAGAPTPEEFYFLPGKADEPPAPTTPPGLPKPGEDAGVETGEQPTFFTDEDGQRWVYNEYTGTWTMVQAPRVPGLTPEQEMAQTEAERAHQMEMLRLQYELEQQAMGQQAGAARGQQEAGAAQQMAQMYAADPYKYWAQMGQGTPGAVARLTRGQVAPGEQMGQVPLSTPSAQWWGGLLPSEQQQIMGGLNWMGVDPQDWYASYQQMIPGRQSRQMGPVWAR